MMASEPSDSGDRPLGDEHVAYSPSLGGTAQH